MATTYEVSEDEVAKASSALLKRLNRYRSANRLKQLYFESKQPIQEIGTLPAKLRRVKAKVSYARLACEALNDSIVLDGWGEDEELLNTVFEQNFLAEEASLIHLDAFKFGVGYALVSHGDTSRGEPEILVTAQSPMHTVAHYDTRSRRITHAIILAPSDLTWYGLMDDKFGTFLTDSLIIPIRINSSTGAVVIDETVEIRENPTGRVPLVPFFNRIETGMGRGHSEVTETLMSLTDAACRTLIGAEINRELYGNPGRYIMGTPLESWVDDNGHQISSETIAAMSMLLVPPNNTGSNPSAGTFQVGSPQPFVDLLRMYATMAATEASIPFHLMGINSSNPTSADAIRASEMQLIKKANRKIRTFERAWGEVAKLVHLLSSGEVPEGARLRPKFAPTDPTAVTAAYSRVISLIDAGVLDPDDELTWTELGFDAEARQWLREQLNGKQSRRLIANLLTQPQLTLAEATLESGE